MRLSVSNEYVPLRHQQIRQATHFSKRQHDVHKQPCHHQLGHLTHLENYALFQGHIHQGVYTEHLG